MKKIILLLTLSLFLTACSLPFTNKEKDTEISSNNQNETKTDFSALSLTEEEQEFYNDFLLSTVYENEYFFNFYFDLTQGTVCYTIMIPNSPQFSYFDEEMIKAMDNLKYDKKAIEADMELYKSKGMYSGFTTVKMQYLDFLIDLDFLQKKYQIARQTSVYINEMLQQSENFISQIDEVCQNMLPYSELMKNRQANQPEFSETEETEYMMESEILSIRKAILRNKFFENRREFCQDVWRDEHIENYKNEKEDEDLYAGYVYDVAGNILKFSDSRSESEYIDKSLAGHEFFIDAAENGCIEIGYEIEDVYDKYFWFSLISHDSRRLHDLYNKTVKNQQFDEDILLSCQQIAGSESTRDHPYYKYLEEVDKFISKYEKIDFLNNRLNDRKNFQVRLIYIIKKDCEEVGVSIMTPDYVPETYGWPLD